MELKVNNILVENVTYNGVELNELQYNGVTVWRREQPVEGDYLFFEFGTIGSSSLNTTFSLNSINYFNNLEYSFDGINFNNYVGDIKITCPSDKSFVKLFVRAMVEMLLHQECFLCLGLHTISIWLLKLVVIAGHY